MVSLKSATCTPVALLGAYKRQLCEHGTKDADGAGADDSVAFPHHKCLECACSHTSPACRSDHISKQSEQDGAAGDFVVQSAGADWKLHFDCHLITNSKAAYCSHGQNHLLKPHHLASQKL